MTLLDTLIARLIEAADTGPPYLSYERLAEVMKEELKKWKLKA